MFQPDIVAEAKGCVLVRTYGADQNALSTARQDVPQGEYKARCSHKGRR